MGSMYWTTEESRYLQAIFTWQDRFETGQDSERARDASANACVGDLRVLLIGAQGVGKTALVTQFCDGTFAPEPDARFTHGGRQCIRIDEHLYTMDVLEMPSQQLADRTAAGSADTERPAAMMLQQALAIAEAAVVVYDVCDPASFAQACRVYARLIEHSREPRPDKERERAKPVSMRFRSYTRRGRAMKKRLETDETAETAETTSKTPFALLFVGNKSDADDDRRRVAWADASRVAGTRSLIEASAKTGAHVDDVFVQIGRDLLQQRSDAAAHADHGRDSSSSLSQKLAVPTPRRPFMARVLLSFRRFHQWSR